jgi:hypothetical protein
MSTEIEIPFDRLPFNASDLSAAVAGVRELFDYDAGTGELLYRVGPRSRKRVGDVVGSLNDRGYKRTKIGGKDFRVHALIWLHQYGFWPENIGLEIDHIDGNRANNRLDNLRIVTRSENMQNTGHTVGLG